MSDMLQEIPVLSDPNDIAPRMFIMTLEEFRLRRPVLLKMFPGIVLPRIRNSFPKVEDA